MIERLVEALTLIGVAKYGRNIAISDKIGYSKAAVAGIMSGQKPLNSRFISAVCAAFGISREWIEEGKEPVLREQRVYARDLQGEQREVYEEAIEAINKSLNMRGNLAIKSLVHTYGPIAVELLREIENLDRDRVYDLYFQLQKVNRGHWNFDDRYDNIAHEEKVKRGFVQPRRLIITQIEET